MMNASPELISVTVGEERSNDRVLRHIRVGEKRVFFELAGPCLPPPVRVVDFAAIAVLFYAMRLGRPMHVHGAVTGTLLRHLEEFQEAWSAWMPSRYTPIEVTAEAVVEDRVSLPRNGAFAFSGGLDAAFALLRHQSGRAGRRTITPMTGMLVQGFDIPLHAEEGFAAAKSKASKLLSLFDIPLCEIRTNWKEVLCSDWEMEYAAGLAACLHQFTGLVSVGVIGSGEDYAHLQLPWASNPVTNCFLGGGLFEIYTEGTGFTRCQKVALVSEASDLAAGLRVCWEGPANGGNCGHCEKCIRTKLNFMANGLEPVCFDRRPTRAEIRSLRTRNPLQIAFLREVLDTAHSRGIQADWIEDVDAAIRTNLARIHPSLARRTKKVVRRAFRRLLYGPPTPARRRADGVH